MKRLFRNVPAPTQSGKENDCPGEYHRQVEITLERETVSVFSLPVPVQLLEGQRCSHCGQVFRLDDSSPPESPAVVSDES